MTDETSPPPDIAAQPGPATAAEPETAGAVPTAAALVPAQRPPAEQQPDHRDGETAGPQGKQAASPVPAPRENGQASLEQARALPARAPARPPKPAPPKSPPGPPGSSRPGGRSRPGRIVTGGAIVMLFLLSAGSAFLLTRHASMAANRSADTQVAIRDRAAAWVASQVSRTGLVSC
ncbi:MAG TPA: hypothetical protein VEG33_20465, partial [Streptosporangiaceae bacterium]|nr:hypothetical protein [Streptosporangiaceae bacterium]